MRLANASGKHVWKPIVRATVGFIWSARTLGASGGQTIAASSPFQWNQIGATRGVPSGQVKASRAGMVERSNSWAIGSLSDSGLPGGMDIPRSFSIDRSTISGRFQDTQYTYAKTIFSLVAGFVTPIAQEVESIEVR